MTYGVAMRLERGLVFAADTRTNAGIDNIAQYRKLQFWRKPGDRVIVLLAAGNLAVTQAVVSLLNEQLEAEDPDKTTLFTTTSLFRTARLVGDVIREVRQTDRAALEGSKAGFNATFILGGQIGTERPRLFQIYAEGNFIEATDDTPFFQIGEHKYGKPILDRAVTFETDLPTALKIGLISMDSTMRSNLAVGLPIDLAVLPRDAIRVALSHRIEPGDAYFEDIRHRWSNALRAAHQDIPRPPYPRQTG